MRLSTKPLLATLALVALAGWGTCAAEGIGDAAVTYRQTETGLDRGSPVAIPGLVRAEEAAIVVELGNGRVVRLRPHSAAFFAPGGADSIRVTVGNGIVEVHSGPDDLALAGARSVFVLEPHRTGPESRWEFVEDPAAAPVPEAEEDREQRRMGGRASESRRRGPSGR